MGQDKVHLVTLLIAPVAYGCVRKLCLQVFKDQVFPQNATILCPQWIPAAGVTNEAGIEGIHLRLLYQLVLATSVVGPHQGHGVCDLQGADMTLHRGPRNTQC